MYIHLALGLSQVHGFKAPKPESNGLQLCVSEVKSVQRFSFNSFICLYCTVPSTLHLAHTVLLYEIKIVLVQAMRVDV
jgi:hypothetical protein